MDATINKAPESINVPEWWCPGGSMMYRRDSLPPEHPESTYNYIKNKLGLCPEDYGVEGPTKTRKFKCPSCGHEHTELMLTKQEDALLREIAGF